jgi:predicted Rossmann fold flavoprotein
VKEPYDVIILGAGASGLMCAAEAAGRGRKTVLLDHGNQTGRKILIAGGGKCNFTNYEIGPENYISENAHFCKSALSRYAQWDFLGLVEKHHIRWEERDHGQLFALESAREIRDMLLNEALSAGAVLRTGVIIDSVQSKPGGGFSVQCGRTEYRAGSLVIATGGLSLPDAGASPLGYRLAEQFGIPVTTLSSGLVPLTLNKGDKETFTALAGIAIQAEVSAGDRSFRENLLFTHRGLSGPVILQVSNYWHSGLELRIDLLPDESVSDLIEEARQKSPTIRVTGLLSRLLPKRLAAAVIPNHLAQRQLKTLTTAECAEISDHIHQWSIKPNGTEGARSAEVTRGGVSVEALSSKTFEVRAVPGLYFIGEVLDVTGWLGGYNLQWAWSSGWCAGQFV